MCPEPCSLNVGMNVRHPCTTPSRLMSTTQRQSSIVASSIGRRSPRRVVHEHVEAAPLLLHPLACSAPVVLVGDVELEPRDPRLGQRGDARPRRKALGDLLAARRARRRLARRVASRSSAAASRSSAARSSPAAAHASASANPRPEAAPVIRRGAGRRGRCEAGRAGTRRSNRIQHAEAPDRGARPAATTSSLPTCRHRTSPARAAPGHPVHLVRPSASRSERAPA